MTFEPQTAVLFETTHVDGALEATPVETDYGLLACPTGANIQIEVLSVGFRANVLPIDTTDVHVDIEFIDDSDSDSVTDIVTDFDMEVANCTALVYNPMWRGSQIMDPGDVLNAQFTVTSPTTISKGAAIIVEYRVLRHS